MTKIDFPRLQERCYEKILENGLRVRVLEKPAFDKSYAVLAVNYGAVDTCFDYEGTRYEVPAGVAHYLEHKMFDLPNGSAMDAFHALGGSPNAFTGYDMTAYFVQSTEHSAENLAALLQMVFTPYFTGQSVEKERGIIAEEIRMYADNAEAQVFEKLFGVMYPTHPVSVPIAGSVESIGEITEKALQLCYDAFYRPENMILCVAGKLPADEVFDLAERYSPRQPHPAGRSILPTDIPVVCARTARQMDVSMPTFAVGVRLPDTFPGDAKTELTCELASELLAGEASRCFRELYENGWIDGGFFIGYEGIRTLSMLSFGGDSDRIDDVIDAVFREAERLRREGPDRTEFERLKRSMLGRRLRDLDSFSATCNRICGYLFDGVEYLDFPEILRSVTEQDVLRLLQYVTKERACISVVSPRQTKEAAS